MIGLQGGPACESCGSPMMSRDERGGRIEGNKYCRLCCNAKGELLSYREVHRNFVEQRLVKINGMDRAKAEESAHQTLEHMPAWRGGRK